MLAFVLKTNNEVERIGDHACSIAKIALKLAAIQQSTGTPGGPPPTWPTSLVELGQRVPMACHRCLRATLDEDPTLAKQVVIDDKVLDKLNRQLFDETITLMRGQDDSHAIGLYIYRVGRELERVGDLVTNIAEDVVYLATGEIIRHEKKRLREQAEGKA